MRTTLKRGIGRGGAANGNGNAQLPPGPLAPVAFYRQPPPPPRSRRSLVVRIIGWAALALLVCVAGVSGGAYLYLHESVAALAPKSADVKRTAQRLDIPLPGEPTNALVIGFDIRAGEAKGTPSRSDTLMLIRADPRADTISLLSFPRDLQADIHCPGQAVYRTKINAAYSNCGAEGALQTVRGLTGVPINYVIAVNFRGFRQLVDKLGGVWMDIDRRYYNSQGGPSGYATINLQPGYQRLGGYQVLDFVRFRHTDSDIHRNARQQQFVRGLKDQIRADFSVTSLPKVIKVLTRNIEVGQGGGGNVSAKTVLSYALLAYSLPPGHVFQSRLQVEGSNDLTATSEDVSQAVQSFLHPDVEAPQKATAVALGEKVKTKNLPPKQTTVTVLNGNGVTGSASNANYLLGQRGYQMVLPANGVPANAPSFDFFRTKVYFEPKIAGAKKAATRIANLFGSADTQALTPAVRQLASGAMVTAVVGQTFHGTLASAPVDQTPQREKAAVVSGTSAALGLLRERQPKVKFPLMVPTVIEQSSWVDRERPIRLYRFNEDGRNKTVRLTYRMGSNEYWGVQETDWDDAPVLGGSSFVRNIGGRRYELFYNGPRLHMVALRTDSGSYWVVNTLLDRLSNETMLAIAKGLRPVASIKK